MSLKKFFGKATDGLLNDDFRQSFLVTVLSSLLAIISAVAAVTHFLKDPEKVFAILMTVAFVFAALTSVLTIFVNKYHQVWRRLFMGLIILFFGYLCYDGGPDGFLHLWILLIPAFSFITFGLKEGFITAIPVFVTMAAFFWWPLADFRKYAAEQAVFDIVDGQAATFSINMRLRLTLLYFVTMFLGYFAELVRHVAAKRLRSFTENFKYASMHDSLTGLANQNYLAKYLDDTYGKDKYEAYALGAYIHSGVSFAFNKGEDTRCRWDSGTVGFVGIKKELNVDLNHYASNLSDAWNGSIERMYVYDNYDNEEVDSITSLSSQNEIQEWKDKMKEQYGITDFKDNNRY